MGDESHFLLKCTRYSNLRGELDQSINFPKNSYLKKDILFQALIWSFPRQTANFKYSAFELRQSKFSHMH